MHASDSVTRLDERQESVKNFLLQQSRLADNLAFVRWLDDSQNRIVEPMRSTLAEITASMLDDLKNSLTSVAENIPAISSSGKIYADNAPLYLRQELLREEYRDALLAWIQAYQHHRGKIANVMKSECFHCLPEKKVCSDSVGELGNPLSDLSEEDTVRRACLILGDIRNQRSMLRWKFWTAPVNSFQSTGFTVISSIALMGHWFAGVAGLGSTGCHYAYEFCKSRKRNNRFALPERNCLRTIQGALNKNRGMIMSYLAEAGIHTDPDSLVSRLKE